MTDIEGSTRLWQERRAAMALALEAHDLILRAAVEQAGGTVVKTTGDGLLAAFDRPESALTAAVAGQRALDRHEWQETGPLRVRMAINSGSAEVRDGDFFGPAVNRVARLMAIGHGGQVLVSDATRALKISSSGLPWRAHRSIVSRRSRATGSGSHVAVAMKAGFGFLEKTKSRPISSAPRSTSTQELIETFRRCGIWRTKAILSSSVSQQP